MFTGFKATESKTFFVGRTQERQEFQEIVSGKRQEWIVQVVGPGGMGKTKLLEQYLEIVANKDFLTTELIIDFYNTSNQTDFGLLREIVRQLGAQHFQGFIHELQEFHRLLSSEPSPTQRQGVFNWVNNVFFQEFTAVLQKGHRILLLFDTTEEMHGVQPYVINTLLPRIIEIEKKLREDLSEQESDQFQTIIVMAGRQRIDFSPEVHEYVLFQDLDVLAKEDVAEFFTEDVLTESQLLALYNRTGGRPLYVALSYDWLVNKVGTLDELLALEPFGQELIKWILRLPNKQKQVILYTSLAWRRMESELLAHLLQVNTDETDEIIQQLIPYSFIKYRKPDKSLPGVLQLHDEMRDLVNDFIWPQEGRQMKEALLTQVVAWYKKRVGDPEILAGKHLPANDEQRALLAEKLFYLCQYDLEQAFETYESLFRNAVHYLDLAFGDLLNREIRRFQKSLTPEHLDELRFREALVAFRQENFDEATRKWESLLRRPGLLPGSKATILMLLVELKAYTGRAREALAHAEEAEGLYQQLMQKSKNEEERIEWERQLMQLYNNWGYAHRVLENRQKALEYYNKALARPERGTDKNKARTLNNVGYLYFLEGDLVQARTRVGLAMKIRSRLGIPYELGLGYNTMGIIMEENGRLDEATDLYSKARLNFENAKSHRGVALVEINFGRIWRINNAFDKAIDELNKACKTFRQHNDKDNLIKALNELGCAHRQRGEGEDYKYAERYLQESLRLSQELNRFEAQVDNWEDLAITYLYWHNRARQDQNETLATKMDKELRKAVAQASQLAEKNNFIYLKGKSEQTIGDLEYAQRNYDKAFEHYVNACYIMSQARLERQRPQIQLDRRFEQTIDRLQENLHALPTTELLFHYAHWILNRLKSFSDEEQKQLQTLREFVEATLAVGESTLLPASGTA